ESTYCGPHVQVPFPGMPKLALGQMQRFAFAVKGKLILVAACAKGQVIPNVRGSVVANARLARRFGLLGPFGIDVGGRNQGVVVVAGVEMAYGYGREGR